MHTIFLLLISWVSQITLFWKHTYKSFKWLKITNTSPLPMVRNAKYSSKYFLSGLLISSKANAFDIYAWCLEFRSHVPLTARVQENFWTPKKDEINLKCTVIQFVCSRKPQTPVAWYMSMSSSLKTSMLTSSLKHKKACRASFLAKRTHVCRFTPVDVGEGRTCFGSALLLILNRLWEDHQLTRSTELQHRIVFRGLFLTFKSDFKVSSEESWEL